MNFNELWALTCQNVDCEHSAHGPYYFHSRCHIKSPTWVMFDPETGNLVITCAECEKEVLTIEADRMQLTTKK